MNLFFCLFIDEGGATAVEYGLLVGLIAMAIIGAVSLMFNSLHSPFGKANAPFSS
ncbi:MAG: Flp family type IVb pilin [Deltaproteobacteria bacterium]|nr:Flp family type IVb pilin [Deltaproteobacteria bacterium]